MVRLWVFVGGLLLVLVSAAFVAPAFIDWQRYGERFEAEVSALLGRTVEVGGIETARLLPFPSITFTDVTVAGEAGDPVVSIGSVSLDAELAPFLRGETLIFDARLVRPQVEVRLDDEGRLRWTPPSGGVDPAAVSIERLTVVDGTVRVEDGEGRPFEATGVDLSVSADTLLGPWQLAGGFDAAGGRYTLEASTGLYEPALRDGVRLLITLGSSALPRPVNLFGTATLADGSLSYEGEFTSDGSAEQPYALAGTFAADPTRIEIETYRLAIGTSEDPYVVSGRATLAGGGEPGFALVARGQRLDTARLGTASEGDGTERLAALRRLVLNAPRPGVDGVIDVSLPAVVFADTTVRDVTVRAAAEAGDWRVERLAAELPGRTALRASGRLAADGSGAFEGRLALASRQPTGLATWLGNPVEEALREVDRLGFEASLSARGGTQRFDDLVVAIGDDRLAGSAVFSAEEGEAGLTLETGALDIDAARAAAIAVTGGGTGQLDVSLDLSADRASVSDIALAGLDVHATASGEGLRVERLSVDDALGVALTADGLLSAVDGTTSELNLTLRTDDPSRALASLDERVQAPWTRALATRSPDLTPASVDGQLAWLRRDAIGFEGTVAAGSAEWSLGGSLSGEGTETTLAALSADGSGPVGVLLRQLGLDAAEAGPVGTATVGFERTAGGSRLDASGASGEDAVSLTLLRSSGDVVLNASAEVASLEVPAALAGLDWKERATAPLDARVTATRQGGLWTLSLDEAQIADTLVTGRLVGDDDRWQGELSTGVLDLPALLTMLVDDGDDPSVGTRRLPDLDLVLSVEARAVALGGGLAARDATFQATLDGEGVAIESFDGGVAGGRLTGAASVRETFDEALVAVRFGLSGATFAELPPLSALPLTAGEAVIAGSVEATGRTLSGLLRSATGAGEAALIDPAIRNLDPFVLARLYERLDASSDPIEPERVESLLREEIGGGSFAPDALAVDWTLSGGTLRIILAEVEDGGSVLSGVADIDVASRGVDGRATFRLAVPDDRAAGGSPIVRLRLKDGTLLYDVGSLAGFLNLRAFEIERDRVAALRAALLEEQRLRRETLLFNAREREREREAARAREQAAANARALAPAAPRLDFNQPIE